MEDPDADIRYAAFERLRKLKQLWAGPIPWSALEEGFSARGTTFFFASKAEGIFKPKAMTGLLSLKTVVPKPNRDVWYHDQTAGTPAQGDTFSYAFSGHDPISRRNQLLRDAMERQLPVIYLSGVAPAAYEPIIPSYVTAWIPDELRCDISFALPEKLVATTAPSVIERRYAMRVVRARLHQATFRERVLDAYGRRCALSNLPEARLIDAAHIVPDVDEDFGQADVRNGVCMSKLHHAAFDAGLIGIDPDMRIHVAQKLLDTSDGPLLEQGLKALQGRQLRPPEQAWARPDPERLARRFAEFSA
jgi:putative restriction endonuclease